MAEMRMTRSRTRSASRSVLDLAPEILLLIFARLDQNDLKSITLVSKSFLALSSTLVLEFTFHHRFPAAGAFRRVVRRFPNVKEVTFYSCPLDRALIAISTANQWSLEGLRFRCCPSYPNQRTIRKLSSGLSSGFKNVKNLLLDHFPEESTSDEVTDFIQLFPSVTKLDFGTSEVKDVAGFEKPLLKVPNLRKIVLQGDVRLTDHSLDVLAANCVRLEEVCFESCYEFVMTPEGISGFLRKCAKKLRSLGLPYFPYETTQASYSGRAETISMTSQNLNHLSIKSRMVFDDVLIAIAKSHPPLTSLRFRRWPNDTDSIYSMAGLAVLFRACQGLMRLDISVPPVQCDLEMSELVKCLPCLKDVQINSFCHGYATLFSLIENCPLLELIEIIRDDEKDYGRFYVPETGKKNFSIKTIKLIPYPKQILLEALKSQCPRLEGY